MQDLKLIIAKNLTNLRQNAKMTQIELAEKLNYSDKAISKWERAESLPDITVLKAIADLFGVPLDYLVRQEHDCPPAAQEPTHHSRLHSRGIITILSLLLVISVATLVYVTLDVILPGVKLHWLAFLYALPAGMIVWLVFNSIWFNKRRNYLIISLLMWSVLLCLTATLLISGITAWQFLLLGIPGQISILVWSGFKKTSKT